MSINTQSTAQLSGRVGDIVVRSEDIVGAGSIEELIERSEFDQGFRNAISELPERENLVIRLSIDEELNLREIGDVLGVGESRVCQIYGQAAERLKGKLVPEVQ